MSQQYAKPILKIQIPAVELADPQTLTIDGDNPNRMTKRQLVALEEDIKRFGFIIPIITNKDGLIADGQNRWEWAKLKGLAKVPIIRLNVSDVDRRMLRQILNKLHGTHLEDLDAREYLKIMEANQRETFLRLSAISDKNFQSIILNSQCIPLDDKDSTIGPSEIKCGDMYRLGNHRLICGDAQDPEIISSLIGEDKVSLIFTDPPYGIDYASKNEFLNSLDKGNRIQEPIKNDDINIESLMTKTLENIKPHLSDYNAYYICIASLTIHQLLDALEETGYEMHGILVWVKDKTILGRIDYSSQHELLAYGWVNHHKFYAKQESSVWFIDKPSSSPLHPTMKPLPLIRKAIQNSSLENEVVLDPFAGSGSTLIACEQLTRRCLSVELDPHYCSVIISRWEQFTGKKAEKLNRSE
jgi:DNA modification methylase